MKKIILFAVAALMTTTSAFGQVDYPKNEIGITYGALSNSDWVGVYEDMLTAPANGLMKLDRKEGTFFGPLSVEYFHHVNSWLAIGGIFVYGQETADLCEGDVKKGDLKNSYYTLMPSVKFDWLRTKSFGLYSKLAIGATYRSETNEVYNHDENEVHVNWQISGLGAEVGSMNLRAFAELGVGEQGIFLAGVRYKF